jgi:hypothetical protein
MRYMANGSADMTNNNRGMVVESQSGPWVWVLSSDRARSRQCQDRLQAAF